MKGRGTHICISLDHAIAPHAVLGLQRTFINCLPSNDLELRFLGTISCEMGDLDQTPPEQTLTHSLVLLKQSVRAYSKLSQMTFERLK